MFGKRKGVDEIIGGFVKTVTELRSLSETLEGEARDKLAEAERLNEQATSARAESGRAETVAAKIEGLLS